MLVWLNSKVGISKFSPKFTENSPKIRILSFLKILPKYFKVPLLQFFFMIFLTFLKNYAEVSDNFPQIFYFPRNFSQVAPKFSQILHKIITKIIQKSEKYLQKHIFKCPENFSDSLQHRLLCKNYMSMFIVKQFLLLA